MTLQEQIRYWIDLAEDDLQVSIHLFDSGYYSWSLFVVHLVLEKILKAIFIEDNKEIPPGYMIWLD